MKKNNTEKYNILLLILIFVIPILTLNISFFLIEKIKFEYKKKEHDRNAQKEADILASEADFSIQLSSLLSKFIKRTKNTLLLNKPNYVESLNNILYKTFNNNIPPNYTVYIFKKSSYKSNTDLIFTNFNNKNIMKRSLCRSFDYLFYTNLSSQKYSAEIEKSKSFAKGFLGEYTDIDYLAKEMRGVSSFSTTNNKKSWFVWDYFEEKNNEVYGFILLCRDINNYAKYGRSIALKNLYSRSKKIGAFIPLYEGFEEGNVPDILNKSDTFNNFIKNLTIKDKKEIDKWFKNQLITAVDLGNYTAYCSLERGASHIAVVLFKSIKSIIWPKWLIFINILLSLIFGINIFYYFAFRKMPSVKLSLRFTILYSLASIIPLSLIYITAHGYLLNFKNTLIDRSTDNLQSVLKSFDSEKSTWVKKYRAAFAKALNDSELNNIIREKGADCASATERVFKIFGIATNTSSEIATDSTISIFSNVKNDKEDYLPILGVKLFDVNGKGAFLESSESSAYDVKAIVDGLTTAIIKLLKNRLEAEGIVVNSDNDANNDNDYTGSAFTSLSGEDLGGSMNKNTSIPILRKNGNFNSYVIFDFIKIENITKCVLLVIWDNQSLDDKLLKNILLKNSIENINRSQNYLVYKISGQKISPFGGKSRHIDNDFYEKTSELAKLSFYSKKTSISEYKDKLIVIMPALNFNNTIFVGWIDRNEIEKRIEKRWIVGILLVLLSIAILLICIIRSVSVFLKPISTVKKALDEVSAGNYNIGFINIPEDELGILSNEFSSMVEGLREKERLSKLISEQAVKALEKNSSGVLSNTETFQGVALVSDIRNFTGMSEKYEPTLITDLLNEHFAEMTKIISDNGGYIYKFIGDAIEAVFPENRDFEKSAYERSFNAGCLMIDKLDSINERRIKNDLFPYKIGVGLCSGEMYSGSVGSFDTRLDYAILGNPLKKAARFEALSIQNPLFPLVFDDYILEKNKKLGLNYKLLNNEGQNISIFSIDNKKEEIIAKLDYTEISEIFSNKVEEKEIDYYSLYTYVKGNKIAKYIISLFFIIILSVFVSLGFDTILTASFNSAKSESDRECIRLAEHLECDEVLKSAYETLCCDFYSELNKLVESKNTNNFKDRVKSICDKYKRENIPLPNVFCCLLKKRETKALEDKYIINYNNKNEQKINSNIQFNNNIKDELFNDFVEDVYYEGFSKDTVASITNLAISFKFANVKLIENCLKEVTGKLTDFFAIESVYYRRSASCFIGKDEMFINTNKISDKSRKDMLIYVFCGFPKKSNNNIIEYCKLLAGKNIMLALNKDDIWHFSKDFPIKEQNFLQINSSKISLLEEKGYFFKPNLKIGEDNWNLYCATGEMISTSRSSKRFIIVSFSLSFLILSLLFYLINIKVKYYGNSIASKLSLDIISSAVLPLIIVGFVSYLYVNESYNNDKSELRYNLNQLINEIENKELYYLPFCEYFIKKFSYNEKLYKNLTSLPVEKDKDNNDYKTKFEVLNEHVDNTLTEHIYINQVENIDNREITEQCYNPTYKIKDMTIVGKNDFLLCKVLNFNSINKYNNERNNYSGFVSQLGKVLFLKDYDKNDNFKVKKEKAIVDEFLKTISSNFGNEFMTKLVNFPNNLFSCSVSYTYFAFFVATIPELEKSDYVIMALVMLDNTLKSYLCNLKNDTDLTLEQHFDSGSESNKLFCFGAPNISVGTHFFFDSFNLINKKENLKTVKELGLMAYWLNASFLPISKKIDLYGPHYLEMRRGNLIPDHIFAAIGSEIPLKKDYYNSICLFGFIILFSINLLLFISKIVVSDLLEPVNQLVEGAKLASKGNYNYRILFDRNDELGILCDSFNKMMKGLEDKQLMNRMVSKTALSVTANTKDISSKKENVFLLYVTVPDFDKVMKELSTLDLFMKLRKQISTIAEIILKEGGDIDKIMGEKLLIVFHINDRNLEDVAYSACNAAKYIENSDKLDFKVSVGVNYGQVISGFLGVGEKRDFTVIGDPVNVTARIAVFAEKLESSRRIVSEQVMEIVKANMKMEEYGEIVFKGKSLPSKVYRII